MTGAGLLIDAAVAKTNKYASRESGDTVEFVERPGGGMSVVLSDGQGTGRAAKTLSMLVTSKAAALLKEGVRDGAVARAVHDHLFTYRHGQVSATLDIVSVDARTGSVVVTRFGDLPMVLCRNGACELVPTGSGPIGRYALSRPDVIEVPAEPGVRVVVVSDGIAGAGTRRGGAAMDLLHEVSCGTPETAAATADRLLATAIRCDDGRPSDDMSVVVLGLGRHEETPLVRRQTVRVPLADLPKPHEGSDHD